MKKIIVSLIICFLATTLFAKNEYIIHRTYYTPPGLVLDGGLTGDMRYVIAIDKSFVIRSGSYMVWIASALSLIFFSILGIKKDKFLFIKKNICHQCT